jgi:alpha-amylase
MPLGPGEFDHYSYAYLEAFDAAGNWSNDSESYSTQLVQQSGMNLGAGWTTSACDCWSGGSVVKSTRVGASAQYQFTGSSVAVVGDYAPNRGTVHVYIDGRLQKSVNTARAINKTRVVIYQRRFNTSQTHTIKLVVGSGRVDVDALIIQR